MEWAPSLPTIMAGHYDAPAVKSPSLPRSPVVGSWDVGEFLHLDG